MKIRKYLAPLLISLGIITGSLMPVSAGAINVFQGACGGGSGNTTTGGTTGADGGAGGAGSTGGDQSAGGDTSGGGDSGSLCGTDQSADTFPKLMHNVINTALIVLGMIAVVMIVVGGIRYTTSNGDPQQVKSAKDTVMYSVVGVVVAIMAYAIINFVLSSFGGSS